MALHPAIEDAARGKVILWGAPTIDQTRIGYEECHHAAWGVAQFHKAERIVEFPGGGRIVYRTLDDPDNGRGFTYDGAVLDEGSLLKAAAFYEVVRPTLSSTGGWCLVIYTPKGRNWVYQEAIKAADSSDAEAWQIPTLGVEIVEGRLIRRPHPLENPTFPFEEAVALFGSLPSRTFEQEFLAAYLEGQGAVFRNVRAVCVLEAPDKPEQHAGHSFVMGVDWGKSNDYTRIGVFCIQCMRMVDWDGFNRIDYHFQREKLKTLVERWGVYDILAESNSIGEPNIDELHRGGLPVRGFATTAASKPALIESLALAIERDEIKLPLEDANELEAYEMKTNANTGRPTYSAPEGMHDDRVMRAALCLHAAIHARVQVF